MVSIVVVSHSAKLAAGIIELAEQVSKPPCRLATAAGIDDPEHPVGTDAIKIMRTIQDVFEPDGVVLMVDMGSAILNAETALELLPVDIAAKVRLCSAPLVEGTLAAVVAASTGDSLEQVIAEAEGALSAKRVQLQRSAPVPESPGYNSASQAEAFQDTGDATTRYLEWQVTSRQGLHTRPAARLVAALTPYNCEFTLERMSRQADPRSLNQIATLQVRHGDRLRLLATGPDAELALAAVQQLVDTGFGEQPPSHPHSVATPAQSAPPPTDKVVGISVSNGICWGPVLHAPTPPGTPSKPYETSSNELLRFESALRQGLLELKQLTERLAPELGQDTAAIFDAQQQLLSDPDLVERLKNRICDGQHSAATAWQAEIAQLASSYRELDDEYMQSRELDIFDIGERIHAILTEQKERGIILPKPVILLAEQLTPSTIATLDRDKILGICQSAGSPLSHASFIAQAMGIPTIVQAKDCLRLTRPDQSVVLDASSGVLWISPDPETRSQLEQKARVQPEQGFK